MNPKEYYNWHGRFRRFYTYYGDYQEFSLAVCQSKLEDYDLTEEYVKDYANQMFNSMQRFDEFKKKKLREWRLILAIIICVFLMIILLLLPKEIIPAFLWVVLLLYLLAYYPFIDYTKQLGYIIDEKYRRYFFKIDPHIERMVDDYLWRKHIDFYKTYIVQGEI